jgi:hypothetical protein
MLDRRIDTLDPYLATSKGGEQTHVCIPPDDMAKKVPRLWNYLPVVVTVTESYIQDTTDLLETSLESPPEHYQGGTGGRSTTKSQGIEGMSRGGH